MERLEDLWAQVPWGWLGVSLLAVFAFLVAVSKKVSRTARTVTIFVVFGVVLIFVVV